jgi:uncharacterized protein YbjT (DUF2867 family)
VIHAYGEPDPPAPRLLAALASRGHAVSAPGGHEAGAAGAGAIGTAGRAGERAVARQDSTLVLSSGGAPDFAALGVLLGGWRAAPGARVLVVSALGAHPDARAARLRWLWMLEEHARASGLPVLTLRLGPILGPRSPLWLRLRRQPRLPRGGEKLLNPVSEADVVETLARALEGRAKWEGWFEVAGPEIMSLKELAALAREAGPPPRGESGAWEPPLRELAEHRLAEADAWLEHFAMQVRPVGEQVVQWAA